MRKNSPFRNFKREEITQEEFNSEFDKKMSLSKEQLQEFIKTGKTIFTKEQLEQFKRRYKQIISEETLEKLKIKNNLKKLIK
jgi:protein associated with RNAse G/E